MKSGEISVFAGVDKSKLSANLYIVNGTQYTLSSKNHRPSNLPLSKNTIPEILKTLATIIR